MNVRLNFPLPSVSVSLLSLERLEEIEEPEERFLTSREQKHYHLLGHPRRRREWLAARVCLKKMLLETGVISCAGACEISKDSQGRPSMTIFDGERGRTAGDCSLSHKGGYAVAAVTFSPGLRVGVDVEQICGRASRIRRQFFHRDDSLPSVTGDDAFHTVLWSIKESASKVLGGGLGVGLARLVCRPAGENLCRVELEGSGENIESAFLIRGDYTVSVGLGRFISEDQFFNKPHSRRVKCLAEPLLKKRKPPSTTTSESFFPRNSTCQWTT